MCDANYLILKSPMIPNLIKCRISKTKRIDKETETEKIPHHILCHGWFNFIRQSKLQVGHYLIFKYHLNPADVHVHVVERNNNA
jgi:uncharacterized protein YjlB